MKIFFLFLVSICAFSQEKAVDSSKPYLDLLLEEEFGLPVIKFLSNKEFSGSPVLELNSKGLFAGAVKLCDFQEKVELTKEDISRADTKLNKIDSKEGCPFNTPIRSYIGDSGIGTPVISIQFEELEGETGIGSFENKKIFLDLKPLAGRYQLYKPRSKALIEKEKADKTKLIKSREFESFRNGISKCLEKKDAACLKTHIFHSFFSGVDGFNCAEREWDRVEWEQKDLQPIAECILANEVIIFDIKKCLTDESLLEDLYDEGGTVKGLVNSCDIQRKEVHKGPWLLMGLVTGS
jgi:hypothetical protein